MENKQQKIDLSIISPRCLIRSLLRNFWMILAAAAIAVMSVKVYINSFRVPEYSAYMTYAVTSRTSGFYISSNLTSAKEVASVFAELIESAIIRENVCEANSELGDFSGRFKAELVPNSNFIRVTATDRSPKTAYFALKTLDELFPSLSDYISDYSVVHTVMKPSLSVYPSNGINERQLCLKFGLAGAVLMAALICLMSVLKETVQTEAGAKKLLDSQIIAVISHESKNSSLKSMLRGTKKAVQVFSPTTSFAYTEQINRICTKLDHESEAKGYRCFLFTGVGENEGKTTVAANTAAALAMKGKNVVLIDADMRKPSLHLFFDHAYTGLLPLNEYLKNGFSKDGLFECMERHKMLGLFMMFEKKSDERSTELLTSPAMEKTLQQLRILDYIIIDTPPMGFFPDAEAIAPHTDAAIMVVRQDFTPACDINDAIDALRESGTDYLGCVLNDMTGGAPSAYGYGYGKYGYGRHERTENASGEGR